MDGIYMDNDTLYIAEGWDGSKIYKVEPNGSVSVFATGLNGPIDIIKRSTGYFYVSEWNQSRISQISQVGVVSPYATVSSGPGPMALDSLENIYVTHNLGNGSGVVTKIDLGGVASILASGSLLVNPGGITFDNEENLFVANFNNGNIIKIDSANTMSLFTTVPTSGTWKTGHLKYRDSCFYVSSLSGQKIFKISSLGIVSTYAGTGIAGHYNSAASISQFSNPNGITFSNNDSKLFVAKAFGSANYIQVVDENITSVKETLNENEYEYELNVYPNPIRNSAKIIYNISETGHVKLSIVSINGNVITTLINTKQGKGTHEISLELNSKYKGVASVVLTTDKKTEIKKVIFN
jgi:hypothetical protein